ncbi:hypothetical protein R1flu_002004 [Riccia fluitans]|uniref:Uncharacterized protein n=1 Tax=Riccia fluitans TaxID=41844 RepID=A0ABD1Y8S5_9MARC
MLPLGLPLLPRGSTQLELQTVGGGEQPGDEDRNHPLLSVYKLKIAVPLLVFATENLVPTAAPAAKANVRYRY